MINVQNVTKLFDDFKALDNVTINVNKGSIYGLIGPNGAGKTTLIKLLTGIYKQNNGEIKIDKQDVYENIITKQKIVYIPDDLYFFHKYKIKAIEVLFSGIYKEFDWDRYEKIKSVIKIDEKKRISKLSKGMKKQVAFWLAISCKPDVLILDEPVDGLDPVMRRQIWTLLLQDVAEREMTVLVSSHNLRELEDVCDHVGFLHKGKLLLERELDELKTDVHKVQTAFEFKDVDIKTNLKVLKQEKNGSVYIFIIRGTKEEIAEELKKYKPLFIDYIPLTLEEIFIYEVGGVGYEVTNIIL